MGTVRLIGKKWGPLSNTFLLTVDDEMLNKLDNYATVTGMHRTELVRRAVHTVFREYEAKPTDDVYDDNDEMELILPATPVSDTHKRFPASLIEELESKVKEDKPRADLDY